MLPNNTLLQGRYLIVEQIGRGGMGAVYKATDTRLRSTIALKETLVGGEMLLKAFEREAQLLAGLRHPALPRVSDHFIDESGQFLVMEFIPGDDLATLLLKRGSPFPFGDVLRWGDQLLDALDYLHSRQPPVVHRDIKPQNMKLTDRGEIILLDFGLAKGAAMQTRVTGTSSIFGYTPHYAPLEQIQGAGTDPRSDLYSLAATMYNLLTGQAPIDALTRAAAKINDEPDPLLAANIVAPDVPPAVADVLTRAMAQNAGQRYPTATAMRAALRDAVTGQLAPPVNSAGLTTRLDHTPLVMVSGASDMQAARPISQPGATGVPLATGTTITPPLSLGAGGTTISPAPAQSGLLKKPWLLAVIIALVSVLGLLLARGVGVGSATTQPTSVPAVVVVPTETAAAQPTSAALNPTALRQTVAAEVIADLTAEAVKRATDIAFARTLANATDSAGTQTAIALTPTGTSPPTEAPTGAPALAPATPTSAPADAKTARPTNTTGPKPPTPIAPTPAQSSSGAVLSVGKNGDLLKGAARKGAIDPALGDGGSCIQGTVLAADGSKFSSFYVQADNRGTTKPAKHFYDTGNYKICGLGAGEWGVAVYAINNTPTSGAEQAGHQVRVQLSGQPGEVFFVDFRAKAGFTPPTAVPEPTAVPPTPMPLAGPYDGQWAGTIRGKTAGDQDFTGSFRFEVRHNAIYSVALDGPSCVIETYPRFPDGKPLDDSSFALAGSPTHPTKGTDSSINYSISGVFSSTSKASGQVNATQNGGSCIVANWNATKQ
jgi:eukaryotic-like serine/threonine-protein kinase